MMRYRHKKAIVEVIFWGVWLTLMFFAVMGVCFCIDRIVG